VHFVLHIYVYKKVLLFSEIESVCECVCVCWSDRE
jgi:hypothetical protein